jgi:biopolymer transport protein ExbD
MRFKRHAQLEGGLKQIDIVPLINVVFLLLIFFMMTSSFVIQPGIKVNLPRVITSEALRPENIELVVSQDNKAYINGRLVSPAELTGLLAQVSQRRQSILIKADRQASIGRIVEIWDLCRSTGIAQVNIATNQ